LNIWIFNHYATVPSQVGGTRHFDLAKHLVKKGHLVTIFASSFNHFSKREMVFRHNNGERYQINLIEGIRFIWIHTPSYKNFFGRIKNIVSYTLKSYKFAIELCKNEKPDIVIGSTVHPLAAVIGYLISKKTSSEYYFEERDLWPQTFIDFGKLSLNNPLTIALFKLEKFLYNKADRIIVLFDKAKQYVTSKGIDFKKVIYLPNGVDFSNYTTLKHDNEIDQMFKGLESKFVVVYTGSHGLANNLYPIIELFSLLQNNSDFHLLMVGEGTRKKDLIKKVKDEEISNVTFRKPISKSKIPYLLSKSQMSIISILDSPLYKWGFSMNKMFDYMAAGLPVIVISNPKLVRSFKNVDGIHVDDNIEKLVKVINYYYENPRTKKVVSKTLKDYVKKNYSWETLSEELETYMLEDLNKKVKNGN
jgi:glycosyltransferase involved in cell wall biosynthesis